MFESWGHTTAQFLRPILAAAIGLFLGVAVTALVGENPMNVARVIIQGALGSPYSLGMTLFYATPLIFTGLAVALPFRAGLFNIGAEGQLTMGSLAVTAVGLFLPQLTPLWAVPLGMGSAFLGGALWAAIPAWCKSRFGSHEVITTMMLNFVAGGLASWAVLGILAPEEGQSPDSRPLAAAYLLKPFAVFEGAPVGPALVLGVLFAGLLAWSLRRTLWGFAMRAVGLGPEAAATAGINVPLVQTGALIVGGGLAGLVGVAEVLGHVGKFRLGFSADYGFVGIPVALLARSHPLGLVASALLFGALQKGTSELDLETEHVTRDLALLIQAMVVLTVAVEGSLSSKVRKWRGRRRQPTRGLEISQVRESEI